MNSRAPGAVAKLLRAVVGVELQLARVEGKAKMSQNKSPQVIGQVIDGLRESGGAATADWMEQHSLPRAMAKADLLAGIRGRQDEGESPLGLSGRDYPDGRKQAAEWQRFPPTTSRTAWSSTSTASCGP